MKRERSTQILNLDNFMNTRKEITHRFIEVVHFLLTNNHYESQKELAPFLGYSESGLSAVMCGKRGVPYLQAHSLAKLLTERGLNDRFPLYIDLFDTSIASDLRDGLTTEFQNSVHKLISEGHFKNASQIANVLNWSSSTMSEVMTDKRPVPYKIAARMKQLADSMDKVPPKLLLPPNNIDVCLQKIDLSADVLIKQLMDVKKEVTKLRETLAGVSTPAPGNGKANGHVTMVLNNLDRTRLRRSNNKDLKQ